MLTQLIAQTSTAGQALDTLSDAIEVSQKTVESWNLVWFNTFNTQESSLWIALVKLGLILAGISVTYLAVTSGKEIIEKQSWSELVAMFIWPLVIVVFLSNNGKVLAESVKFIKAVGSTQVQEIMKIQVGEMTFRTALSDVNLTSAGKEEIEKLYSECQGKVGSTNPSGSRTAKWRTSQKLAAICRKLRQCCQSSGYRKWRFCRASF